LEHNDTFTLGVAAQKKAGNWFFRKETRVTANGNMHGLEITIGSAVSDMTFGGVLIKTIKRINQTQQEIKTKVTVIPFGS